MTNIPPSFALNKGLIVKDEARLRNLYEGLGDFLSVEGDVARLRRELPGGNGDPARADSVLALRRGNRLGLASVVGRVSIDRWPTVRSGDVVFLAKKGVEAMHAVSLVTTSTDRSYIVDLTGDLDFLVVMLLADRDPHDFLERISGGSIVATVRVAGDEP